MSASFEYVSDNGNKKAWDSIEDAVEYFDGREYVEMNRDGGAIAMAYRGDAGSNWVTIWADKSGAVYSEQY